MEGQPKMGIAMALLRAGGAARPARGAVACALAATSLVLAACGSPAPASTPPPVAPLPRCDPGRAHLALLGFVLVRTSGYVLSTTAGDRSEAPDDAALDAMVHERVLVEGPRPASVWSVIAEPGVPDARVAAVTAHLVTLQFRNARACTLPPGWTLQADGTVTVPGYVAVPPSTDTSGYGRGS